MKISIIGSGYVGLVTGTCLSETGNNVTCIDNNKEKVTSLKNGIIPIYEPGLDELFKKNVKRDRLHFTADLEAGLKDAQIVFLAIPTPLGTDGRANLSYVLNSAEDLSGLIKKYVVVVNKSTVPVGTAAKVKEILGQKLSPDFFDVVSNPEFLREGRAVENFMKPERVIVGTSSKPAIKLLTELYQPYTGPDNPIILMDEKSAELTKYAANTFLATKISFINEIANLCDQLGANIDYVRAGISSDSRIGKKFLLPGVGYGGSCLPKDIMSLAKTAADNKYDFKILQAVIDTNNSQKLTIAKKIKKYFGITVRNQTIAIWGLSFKPDTDDIREAPAIHTIDCLLEAGAKIKAYDPEAMPNTARLYGDRLTLSDSLYEAVAEADALAIITEWEIFKTPDLSRIKSLMKQPLIFDGRNLYDHSAMHELGFEYHSIGRPQI